MASKTVQALKISATVALAQTARTAVEGTVLPEELDGVKIATAKLRVTHAIVARYDDPAYSAAATARIAEIKAALSDMGELEAWHVTAGAVPEAEAEVVEIDAPAAE